MCGKKIDLHAHTRCSDGSFSPEELVMLASRKGLAALAVTDHDTAAGVEEAMAAGAKYGVEVIPGVELSTRVEGREVHIIGLFVDAKEPEFAAFLQEIAAKRRERNRRMLDKLIEAGFPISPQEIVALGDGVLTRGSLAGLLVDKGYEKTVRGAMEAYLSPGKVGYVPKPVPTPREAVDVIHRAGGLAFVAHFHQINRGDLRQASRIAGELIAEDGADGLETKYSEYDDKLQAMAEAMAKEHHCLRSGGSDFHGVLKPGLELGSGYEDLSVPYSYLERMKEYLRQKR